MVRNRDHWTITTIDPDGDVTATGRTGTVHLPADYVAAHVELAYAQTGHAAQGRTVDHSLLLVDTNIDNRGVYVPLTRGRLSNHAYVALEPDDPRSRPRRPRRSRQPGLGRHPRHHPPPATRPRTARQPAAVPAEPR